MDALACLPPSPFAELAASPRNPPAALLSPNKSDRVELCGSWVNGVFVIPATKEMSYTILNVKEGQLLYDDEIYS